MYKGNKKYELIVIIALVVLISFTTSRIQIDMDTDINKIIPEMFSLAAVNADYHRPTLLEEFDNMTKTEYKEKEPEITQEAKSEKQEIKITEKKVTYASNPVTYGDYKNMVITNHTNYEIDLESLMDNYKPPVRKDNVQILVIHTHATEGYSDSVGSRTTDTNRNMIHIGNVFTESLKAQGFNVVHDVKLHDYPSYNGSYTNSLKVMNWYMEHYPDIDIIFDLHRDAVGNSDDSRVKFVTEINGQKAAQLMLVAGTNEGGLSHPHWKENLKFGAGLQNTVCSMYPDLMRAVDLRKERFNQHVTKNSIIVEVGSNGNTLSEAEYSVKLLAEALGKYIT